MATAPSSESALAQDGPLDGTHLGCGSADDYEVRMADGSVHVYSGSERTMGRLRLYDYSGRR